MDTQKMQKLQEIQEKNQKALEIINQQKEARKKLLSEITETVSEDERNIILASAEKDFLPSKIKFDEAKSEYANALEKYNGVCDLLNYRIKNSFGKVKNQITIEKNIATVMRDGKSISFDITNAKWQKNATSLLESDLQITNGTARNIVYKISVMMKDDKAK